MRFEPRDAGDPVVSAGHRNPPVAETPQHHAERERNHQKVDVAHVRDQQAERGAEHRAQKDPARDARPEASVVNGGEDGDGVGGHSEKAGVAERRQTGVPQ